VTIYRHNQYGVWEQVLPLAGYSLMTVTGEIIKLLFLPYIQNIAVIQTVAINQYYAIPGVMQGPKENH